MGRCANFCQRPQRDERFSDMTIRSSWVRGLAIAGLVTLLAACASRPQIRTQSAPELDTLKYQTFGFVEHPDTDKSGYTTLTERATGPSGELQRRQQR
jgi:hypothetical protein